MIKESSYRQAKAVCAEVSSHDTNIERMLGNGQCVVDRDAEISHRAFQLRNPPLKAAVNDVWRACSRTSGTKSWRVLQRRQ